MAAINDVIAQLDAQGVADYVCFAASGLPAVAAKGIFSDSAERTNNAFAFAHQANSVLAADEKLKKATATFGATKLVATTMVANDGQSYAIVVRR